MSKEGSRQPSVRREGDGIWRPSIGARILWLAMVAVLVPAALWLIDNDSELSSGRAGVYVLTALGLLITLPVVLFRWRLVLEDDEVLFVFIRVRRMPLRTIVAAKCVARDGLVLVGADGRTESFAGLGNSAWSHRRKTPTRSDLAARTILCAAATARGEIPPLDYRLPPMTGALRAAIDTGIGAFVLGLFLGD